MLVWGKSPLHGLDDHTSPKNIFSPGSLGIKRAVLGDNASSLLLIDGSIQTYGKIQGLDDKIIDVTSLKDSGIVDLFGGVEHTFAVDKNQKMFGWGCNTNGQLGFESEDEVLVPKLTPLSLQKNIINVACGQSHSIMLTKDGKLYAMGDNKYGQLGIGNLLPATTPICIDSLSGVPVRQIATGGWHSFCVTTSGRVFGWGRNDYGQLGLGHGSNCKYPKLIKSIDHPVVFTAAGDCHSAMLTKKGEVLTFGLGSSGQLGHDTYEREKSPKLVEEFRGSIVTQIACGFNHTVAFVPDCGHVFVFGDNTHGQLWFDQRTKIIKPEIIYPNLSRKDSHTADVENNCYQVMELYACGNQTAALVSINSELFDFRNNENDRSIATLDKSFCDKMPDAEYAHDKILLEELHCVLTSRSCFNGCFSLANQVSTMDNPGLNLTDAKQIFAHICQSKDMQRLMATWLSETLLPDLLKYPPDNDIESLKIYILLPFLINCFQTSYYLSKLFFSYIDVVLLLKNSAAKRLSKWYKSMESDFSVIVKLCSKSIYIIWKIMQIEPNFQHVTLRNLLQYIQKLYKLNVEHKIICYREFYVPFVLSERLLSKGYVAWSLGYTSTTPIFISHSFLFDAKVKSAIIRTHVQFQKQGAIGVISLVNNGIIDVGDFKSPFIHIEVDRKNLVSDAIRQLERLGDLQTILQVRFKDEAGIDAGALTKEFFMLFFEEVLSTNYDIFCQSEYSNLLWFSEFVPGTESIYHLVGMMCGLALFNDANINVNFPLAMYKKLLSHEPILKDLKELDPMVGSSLQKLLDFEEQDGVTFDKKFVLSFTSTTGVPLKMGGQDVAVTSENRQEYVDLCVKYVLNVSVQQQYDAFSKGFLKVCSGELLNLFHPEELMEVVVGQQDFDWKEVESRMRKTSEQISHKNYKVFNWFWEVLHSLSSQEKNEFLVFLTGSNKVPITGLRMGIDFRDENNTFLPVALTCFNKLQLHCYSSKEILEERLKLSITCKGFHIQ